MKIGQLIAYSYDIGCGSSEQILETCKNVDQLESAAEKLNKKFGRKDGELSFSVKVIDTQEVKDSLSRKELASLWR